MSGGYLQTNLVSDLPGVARVTDPNLVNPWGLAYSPSGPFWVSDNNAGASTLYDGQGQLQPFASPLVVSIPGPAGGPAGSMGAPTGTAFNGGPGFIISANEQSGPSLFLFATEDGTIAGWNPSVDLTHALIAVDNSSAGAVYKGLALGADSSGRTLLFATNFRAGTIDVFDQSFQAVRLAGSFSDPTLPAGFAPFGIQNINGLLYVTYAQQDPQKHDDVPGLGNGFVDVFNGDGVLQQRLVSQGPLDSPWGLALAPASFGQFSHDLLVGNFGDGHINAFAPSTGRFLGQLQDGLGHPLTIDHLWGLAFGNGAGAGNAHTLFFSAGIDDERHGLFGELQSRLNVADIGDGLAGNLYGAPTDPFSPGASAPRPATPGDSYPLPPAGGPAPRADIEVQPSPLPLAFLLKDPPPGPAPAMLTVSERPLAATVAGGTGNGSAITATPATPSGAHRAGLLSADSPADWEDASQPSRPGALETLLTLRTQVDVLEELDARQLPGRTESRLPDDPTPIQATREDVPGQERGPEEALGSVAVMMPLDRTQAEHQRALVTAYALAALLVAGGVSVTWGIERATRGANRTAAP
jgi:uncharacterized protein (TIGR03118 family)